MPRKLFLTICCLLISLSLFSQEIPVGSDPDSVNTELYTLGDQTFAINAGTLFPLFFQNAADGTVADSMNLSIGLGGSLAWNTYLSNNLSLGIDVGGLFSFSPNSRTLVMVPITVKGSYWFYLAPFQFALSLSPGLNLCKLDDSYYLGPILAPGASAYWNYDSKWGFGAELKYSWIPQLYFNDGSLSEQSFFGNFLSLTLSAQYHF